MSTTVNMTEAGLVALPEFVRKRFGLTGAAALQMDVLADGIMLKPQPSDDHQKSIAVPEAGTLQIEKRGHRRVITGTALLTADDLIQVLKEDRDERVDHLLGCHNRA